MSRMFRRGFQPSGEKAAGGKGIGVEILPAGRYLYRVFTESFPPEEGTQNTAENQKEDFP